MYRNLFPHHNCYLGWCVFPQWSVSASSDSISLRAATLAVPQPPSQPIPLPIIISIIEELKRYLVIKAKETKIVKGVMPLNLAMFYLPPVINCPPPLLKNPSTPFHILIHQNSPNSTYMYYICWSSYPIYYWFIEHHLKGWTFSVFIFIKSFHFLIFQNFSQIYQYEGSSQYRAGGTTHNSILLPLAVI